MRTSSSVKGIMKIDVRPLLVSVTVVATLSAACVSDDRQEGPTEEITIPNLTGIEPDRALRLIGNLDLSVEVEEIDVAETDAAAFARDVVVDQDPHPDTRVAAGTTLTLFVPLDPPLRSGEQPFSLLTHCGLSYPLEFEDRFWLPVDQQLRRTINPPKGFHSDGYEDAGTIRRVDADTIIYTSSTGREVEYEPTEQGPGGCD